MVLWFESAKKYALVSPDKAVQTVLQDAYDAYETAHTVSFETWKAHGYDKAHPKSQAATKARSDAYGNFRALGESMIRLGYAALVPEWAWSARKVA